MKAKEELHRLLEELENRQPLRPEYKFDYSKALPNRFAVKRGSSSVVVLDSDVTAVFKDAGKE